MRNPTGPSSPPRPSPCPALRRLAFALAVAPLVAACGDDGGTADAVDAGDDVHHLEGPGCEDEVRYQPPLATGVGGAARALPGARRVPTAAAYEASLCSDFCHAAERCGDDFGGRAACIAHCEGLLDDGRVNAVACYASDCRERTRCLDGGPVEAVTGCHELCAAVASCPSLAIFGLTAEESACRSQCAGRAAARPSFADAVPCLANAAAGCDLDEALECLSNGGLFCPSVCLEVEACPAGSSVAGIWPTRAACFAECDARAPVMAYKAATCFERRGCDADRACLDEVSPVCEAYFDEAARSCDASASWPASFQLMAATCDLDRFGGLDDTSEVAACLKQRGSCAHLEDRLCQAESLAGRVARCEGICSAMCDCGLLRPDDCLRLCASAEESSAELDVLEACIADDDCDALTACADEVLTGSTIVQFDDAGDPCDRYCQARVACEGDAVAFSCRAECAARLDAGDSGPLAAVACHEAGGCAALASCDATAPSSGPCAAACDDASVACGLVLAGFDAGRSACTAYCSGLVTTWGTDDAATASCVVGATDARCTLSTEAGCAPQPQ